jgi:type IV secretion system protein VirD4
MRQQGWGPSGRRGYRPRTRYSWWDILAALSALWVIFDVHPLALGIAGGVGVLLVGGGLVWLFGGLSREKLIATVVEAVPDPIVAVRKLCADEGGGPYLGIKKGDWKYARRERAVLILGPPRSGKTSSVIIPTIVSYTGPVVSTSTKTDVADATDGVRRRFGRIWLFEPTGIRTIPEGVERLRWSPAVPSHRWERAMLMARAMTTATGVGEGTTHSSHWASRAQALLAPLLHAAALNGRDMEQVVDWVMAHELDEAGILLEQDQASKLAFSSLLGILNTEERERASIFSAAADALQAYNSEAALETARQPNFSPDEFVQSEDTIYILAPAEEQAAAAPIVCGLLSEIRRATYQAYAQRNLPNNVLFALDEVANIAPLDELPAIASEGGGQGLTLLAALQDLSQARVRWKQAADGFLTLFGTKLILPGIADSRTLDAVSTALGEYDRRMVSTTRGPAMRGSTAWGSTSRTTSYQRTAVLSPGEVANIPAGHGLHLDGLAWQLLTLTPAHATKPWATLIAPTPTES